MLTGQSGCLYIPLSHKFWTFLWIKLIIYINKYYLLNWIHFLRLHPCVFSFLCLSFLNSDVAVHNFGKNLIFVARLTIFGQCFLCNSIDMDRCLYRLTNLSCSYLLVAVCKSHDLEYIFPTPNSAIINAKQMHAKTDVHTSSTHMLIDILNANILTEIVNDVKIGT